MSVAFKQGDTIGRGDLDIFLSNSNGNVANAYEIFFGLYYVDPITSAEVLIGGDRRQPMNPSVGEYYAALAIPMGSTVGDYRIRWTFKEFASSPYQQVVQEFNVVGESVITTTTKTPTSSIISDHPNTKEASGDTTKSLDTSGKMKNCWNTSNDLSTGGT
jgi:hypothetical protein